MNANLKAKLTTYSIFGSAFLFHSNIADAQVICNDYDPDLLAGWGSYAYVDLDNDGQADFFFGMFHTSAGSTLNGTATTSGYLVPYFNNAFIGANLNIARKLSPGDTIGANLSWWNNDAKMFKYHLSWLQDTTTIDTLAGEWNDTTDGYLPVLLIINAENHYGWIRCSTNRYEISIKESAFNLTPNTPILAGQCDYALSTPKLPTSDQVKMNFCNNNLSLKISDPQFEQGELRVYNTEAQTILATDRTATGNNFNLQTCPAGLYYAFYRKNDKVFVLKFAKQ